MEGAEEQNKEKLEPIKIRTTDDTSRSSSPNVATIPISMRQQQLLLKQMEQPSPGGSTDSERPMTPSRKVRVAKIHKKNNHGETPLHVAARRGQIDKCAGIIKDGADVNCPDYAGWTPLHEACSHQAFDVVKLLIENGADVNKTSEDGQTPLHDAAANSDIQICWLLLQNNADRTLRNRNNQRPVDLAKDKLIEDLLNSTEVPAICPKAVPPSSPKSFRRKIARTPTPPEPEVGNFEATTSMDQSENSYAELGITPMEQKTAAADVQRIEEQPGSVQTDTSSLEIIEEPQPPQTVEVSQVQETQSIVQNENSLNLSEASTSASSSRHASPAPAQESSASVSPERTIQEETPQASVYDYQEEEVREEEVKKKIPKTPKGKVGKTNSGTATPVGKKGFKGGGRGGKRGGRGGSRVAELAAEQLEPMADDPYAFRATPDSELDINEESEALAGPSKRAKIEEEAIEEEPEEEEETKANVPQKKVPILRISFNKAPSEEEDHIVTYGKTKNLGNRGKAVGKRGADTEEQRVTRSKVRQAGRGLDDDTTWANKKKRNRQAPEPIVEEVILEDFPMARLVERQATPNPETLTEGQKLLYMAPHSGVFAMKKTLEARWMEETKNDERNAGDTNARFSNLLLCSEMRPMALKTTLPYDTKLPRLPPDMQDPVVYSLLTKHLQERKNMLMKMKVDRQRKQLCYEQEYIRMKRREDGTAPQMSAVRIFREAEMYNPLMLDDPAHKAPLIDRAAFETKVEKGIYVLYREHKEDAETLNAVQREELRQLWKKKGANMASLSESLLSDLTPLIHPERLTVDF